MITTYLCTKCNFKWIIEIDHCIRCHRKIFKESDDILTVIGFTEIHNPSTSHSETPYTVVLTQDKNSNIRPFKTKKKFSLGDNFVH
jgi:hypothetical protein